EEFLSGMPGAKFTPLNVAQWIEHAASSARMSLAEANRFVADINSAAYRRASVDIEIQASLGEFFAAKFRAGVLFHLYKISPEQARLAAAVDEYKNARTAFAAAAEAAKGVYLDDVTFGEQTFLRGHWRDRLPAIDRDIEKLAAMLERPGPQQPSAKIAPAIP